MGLRTGGLLANRRAGQQDCEGARVTKRPSCSARRRRRQPAGRACRGGASRAVRGCRRTVGPCSGPRPLPEGQHARGQAGGNGVHLAGGVPAVEADRSRRGSASNRICSWKGSTPCSRSAGCLGSRDRCAGRLTACPATGHTPMRAWCLAFMSTCGQANLSLRRWGHERNFR